MSARLRTVALASSALLVANVAAACPVCFDAEEEARFAYQLGTAAMTFLPLIIMGGAALFLRHRMKQRELQGALLPQD